MEKEVLAVKKKSLQHLKSDLKEACTKIFKRQWEKESDFEDELERVIKDLQTCIDITKVITEYYNLTYPKVSKGGRSGRSLKIYIVYLHYMWVLKRYWVKFHFQGDILMSAF